MVDIERYLGKYVSMLIHSYNPDQYVRMMEYRWRRYARFALITLGIAILLFLVILLPVAFAYINALPARMQEVDTFTLSANVSAEGKVELVEYPSIVMDLNATGGEEDFVITREGLIYPRFLFFGNAFLPWEELRDLKERTEARDDLLVAIMLFMLPSIIFWFVAFILVKLLLVFILFVLIGYFGPRAFKYRIRLSETVKAAILAMPSVTIIGLGLSQLAPRPMFWWGLLLSSLIFVLGVLLLSEPKSKRHKV